MFVIKMLIVQTYDIRRHFNPVVEKWLHCGVGMIASSEFEFFGWHSPKVNMEWDRSLNFKQRGEREAEVVGDCPLLIQAS